MPSIKNLKALGWHKQFYMKMQPSDYKWPDELTEAHWDKRGLIARKEKTGVSAKLKKHAAYFKKNTPPEVLGRNWGEVEGSCKTAQEWMRKHGKKIYENFKDLRDTLLDAEKTFKKSKVISKSDTKRAKDMAKAADMAMISWNKNSLSARLSEARDLRRKEIYDKQVKLIGAIVTSTAKVPEGVRKRTEPAFRKLRDWDHLDEGKRDKLKSKMKSEIHTACRNMTQSVTNYVKSADMGIELEHYDARACKKLSDRLVKYANQPGFGDYVDKAGDDGDKLMALVVDVEELLKGFEKYVLPIRVAQV